ncbi:unnamed protein product [Trichogramma brassicae]|uniref:Uncharacterized protein n=1 Tax=Trichogramma brassicae TaxID=86971 RepID=A0A6H5IGH1_9HYME|nr:unnamed protein product [Trichogramma brassicae]
MFPFSRRGKIITINEDARSYIYTAESSMHSQAEYEKPLCRTRALLQCSSCAPARCQRRHGCTRVPRRSNNARRIVRTLMNSALLRRGCSSSPTTYRTHVSPKGINFLSGARVIFKANPEDAYAARRTVWSAWSSSTFLTFDIYSPVAVHTVGGCTLRTAQLSEFVYAR